MAFNKNFIKVFCAGKKRPYKKIKIFIYCQLFKTGLFRDDSKFVNLYLLIILVTIK